MKVKRIRAPNIECRRNRCHIKRRITMDKKVKKNQSEVGERMKTLRLKQGMTQSELADEFSYTSQNISQIENGRINPSVDVLKVYSEYFHVSIDFLLNGENFHSELKASGIEGDLDIIQKTVTHIKEKLRSKDCLHNERSAC